jgi:diaminohydroxyphosphoribosylaminopyrimidine deaminase / 5-amino-6-(5-phosphoribosylamino)uracil reductase
MHRRFLLQALSLARQGLGQCSPNPSVGALAVHNGVVIAQSWHRGAGTLHAEPLVLQQIPAYSTNITLYVTLEPCNHFGRTPPCVEAIIAHGISKVVYAYKDPNPLVSGKNSSHILEQAGVSVEYCRQDEIDDFYHDYAYWVKTKMPFVRSKIAQSFDAKIAGFNGDRVQISNSQAADLTHQYRLHADIILTTSRTITFDDPSLTVRLPHITCFKPLAIIASARNVLNKKALSLRNPEVCYEYFVNCDNISRKNLRNGEVFVLEPSAQVLHNIISDLGKLGYHSVFVEAGASLFNALHKLSLVQETIVYLAPKVLGSKAIPAYGDFDIFTRAYTVQWRALDDNIVGIFTWEKT